MTTETKTEHPDMSKPVRSLTCCCCGAYTTGRQHWNRDSGYGLGDCCIDFATRGMDAESIARTYGVRGVHYGLTD